jgi:hypothetical protein
MLLEYLFQSNDVSPKNLAKDAFAVMLISTFRLYILETLSKV